jgi:hypothetical protein
MQLDSDTIKYDVSKLKHGKSRGGNKPEIYFKAHHWNIVKLPKNLKHDGIYFNPHPCKSICGGAA